MSGGATYQAIAARQYGLVTTWQLEAAGLSRRRIDHLAQVGALEPVRRRVYRIAGTTPSWMSSVLATVLAARDGALATHETAGYLYDLRHMQRPAKMHLLSARRLRMTGVEWHAPPRGLTNVATRYRRIPITTVEVTVALIAGRLGKVELGELVDDALRRNILRLERLRQVAIALDGPGRRNLGSMKAVLAERPRHYRPGDSDWEQAQDRLWRRLELPPAVRQHVVTLSSGRRYTLDRALPDLRIGVEWDGYAFHHDRTAFDRDRQRDGELTAAGWAVLRFTSNSTPAFIARTVRETIEQQQLRQLSSVGPSASAARTP